MPQILESVGGRKLTIDAGFAKTKFPNFKLDGSTSDKDATPRQRVDSGVFDWYAKVQRRPANSHLPQPPASGGIALAAFADACLGPHGARQVTHAIGQGWTAKTALAFALEPGKDLSVSGYDLKKSALRWLLSHFGELAHTPALQQATDSVAGLDKLNAALLGGVQSASRKRF